MNNDLKIIKKIKEIIKNSKPSKWLNNELEILIKKFNKIKEQPEFNINLKLNDLIKKLEDKNKEFKNKNEKTKEIDGFKQSKIDITQGIKNLSKEFDLIGNYTNDIENWAKEHFDIKNANGIYLEDKKYNNDSHKNIFIKYFVKIKKDIDKRYLMNSMINSKIKFNISNKDVINMTYKDILNLENRNRKNSVLIDNFIINTEFFLKDIQGNNEKQKLSGKSLGEQHAMFLKQYFKNIKEEILIIDQPENDLDGQTIYEDIIKKLLEWNFQKQIILITHNAMLAINSDPQTIIWANYNNKNNKRNYINIDINNITDDGIHKILDGRKEFPKNRYMTYGGYNVKNADKN